MSSLNKTTKSLCAVKEVSWHTARKQLSHIRQQVFIVEQKVPTALEWDGLDEDALHLLAYDIENNAIGCARILNIGHLGRMAVLKEWRGMGIGAALLQAVIAVCRTHHWSMVKLSAQTHAVGFYEKAGFTVCSDEYLDAGIPHQDMVLKLAPAFADTGSVR